MCLGSFTTSPIPSLYVEAKEMPPDLRRKKLSLQYMVKLKSNPSNPAYSCVCKAYPKALFDARPSVIPTLGIRMRQQLRDTGINLDCIARSCVPAIPPWLVQMATFFFLLHPLASKGDIPPDIFRSKLAELLSAFDGYERIYTDGSKDGEAVAAAAVSRYGTLVKRLTDHACVFSAEARAVLLALDTESNQRVKSF
jgi:hypothetical protein